ncbi:uncharacterized protein LOC110346517 [Heterocephalus glaber]|uniref:Uncharacterized protein LOC110346517 n=1 Tax=Heterocephalus glaber TaxID=10181 RepID=A0AAX6S1Q7_HETGA|nr:uncharacterized protein LOC110346517 [Heterocephalus glaber]
MPGPQKAESRDWGCKAEQNEEGKRTVRRKKRGAPGERQREAGSALRDLGRHRGVGGELRTPARWPPLAGVAAAGKAAPRAQGSAASRHSAPAPGGAGLPGGQGSGERHAPHCPLALLAPRNPTFRPGILGHRNSARAIGSERTERTGRGRRQRPPWSCTWAPAPRGRTKPALWRLEQLSSCICPWGRRCPRSQELTLSLLLRI